MANANAITLWRDASDVDGAYDEESGNTIEVYENFLSRFAAYQDVLTASGEHATTWRIRLNHAKLKTASAAFRETFIAHEWGHTFGLGNHGYSQQLMFRDIWEGGGTADGPEREI
ncbi:hypothetical protein ACFSCX_17595 [Bacillus salitolerans]|uniref:Peptidase M10 metallopeptidase domain-containing protein n=1 Tax=Bacillus salitolerans TaxID=1437434 RepID=A0ABW4LW17_9BACI